MNKRRFWFIVSGLFLVVAAALGLMVFLVPESIPRGLFGHVTGPKQSDEPFLSSGECALVGDNPPCDIVALYEVVSLINQWAGGHASLSDVIKLINKWTNPGSTTTTHTTTTTSRTTTTSSTTTTSTTIPRLALSLSAPANNTDTTQRNLSFNYTVTGSNSTYNCSLFLNRTLYNTSRRTVNNTLSSLNATNLGYGTWWWNITCNINASIYNTSKTRTLIIQATTTTTTTTSTTTTTTTTITTTTTSTTTTTTTTSTTVTPQGPVVIGYIDMWNISSGINCSKINFTQSAYSPLSSVWVKNSTNPALYFDWPNKSLFIQCVNASHRAGTKTLLTLSEHILKTDLVAVVSSDSLRASLITNLVHEIDTTGYDGIDINWESLSFTPNRSGNQGSDEKNQALMHLLVQDLYNAIHPMGKTITISPDIANYQVSVADVNAYVDYVMPQTYYGSITTAETQAQAWVNKGYPKNKIAPGRKDNNHSSGNISTLAQWIKDNGYGGVMIYTISRDQNETRGKTLQAVYDVFNQPT
jgi:hypothetical protein